jgi:hypothetical protein
VGKKTETETETEKKPKPKLVKIGFDQNRFGLAPNRRFQTGLAFKKKNGSGTGSSKPVRETGSKNRF